MLLAVVAVVAVGLAISACLAAAAILAVLLFFSSSAFSASGSYPNFSILSASAFAAFSAASKSISSPTTFLAPSFWFFFAPRMFVRFGPAVPPAVGPVLRIAEAGVVRIAAGAGSDDCATSAGPSVAFSGDLGLAAAPFAVPAERNGEPVRGTTVGVPTLEGGLLGLLMAGLSQEEKKSSSAFSVAGVADPSPGVPITSSVIWTSSGYL